ncbi:nucleoside/nucleotide kinase family protein [Nakamurella silvestris]|nr:nucleoside/nucleotide kinase family protein [Nakamurella silvestris]
MQESVSVDVAAVDASPAELAERVLSLRVPGRRVIIGVTGPPGTGKTTLINAVLAALPAEVSAAGVPMDGFHLSNRVLDALGRSDRKGAIDTFDAGGYALLLERLRRRDEDVVYAPDFDHGAGDPVAASVSVGREVEVVFTDGNYLLSDTGPWLQARAVMDEVWYLDTPDELRLSRLITRHVQAGKSPDAASAWARGTDEANAVVVARTRAHADLILHNR